MALQRSRVFFRRLGQAKDYRASYRVEATPTATGVQFDVTPDDQNTEPFAFESANALPDAWDDIAMKLDLGHQGFDAEWLEHSPTT
jgi:hypothetical protein